MKRYEVVTPTGHIVAVPKEIWRAWPPNYRRYVEVDEKEFERLRLADENFHASVTAGFTSTVARGTIGG